MMNDRTNRLDFKVKMSPHLEVLMRLSLSLTGNGRDAIRLMREGMAEVSTGGDEWMSLEGRDVRLYEILTRRFFNGFQQHSRPLMAVTHERVDERLIENNRLFPATSTNAGQKSTLTGESDEHITYFRGIVGLPAVFRSAMILSYIEGFSNEEIAGMAGVQAHTIESLLIRGCGLLREELFELLTGTRSFDTQEDSEAQSAYRAEACEVARHLTA